MEKSGPLVIDTMDDVIWVVSSVDRAARTFLPDGTPFIDYDAFLYNVSNSNYRSFNPFAQSDEYTLVLIKGIGAVFNTYTSIPSSWIVLFSGLNYNMVLIK